VRINSINASNAYSSRSLNRNQNSRKNSVKHNSQYSTGNITFGALPRRYDKVLLMILDGFGLKEGGRKNPFSEAYMPFFKSLTSNSSGDTLFRPIEASGTYVGLPPKLAGSSEVGHNNLGAGRMIPQDLMIIDEAIKDRSFRGVKPFIDAMQHVQDNKSTLHLMTLLSDGYVHSSTAHLFELIKMAGARGIEKLKVHAFLDGRDVKEGTAIDYINKTNAILKEYGYDQVASFIGMKYPMDRARDWSKTGVAYDLLVNGKAEHEAKTFEEIYRKLHTFTKESGKYLEKDMPPVKLEGFEPIKNGDSVIFTNYRNDRTRQLTDAITQEECTAPFLEGQKRLEDINFVCMTEYDPSYHLPVAFPVKVHSNTLTQTLNDQKFYPWVAAETEKQAHVTFFFDGKKHIRFSDTSYFFPASDHEKLTPKMEAGILKDTVLNWIKRAKSKGMIVNFANPDMIGHEANYEKARDMLELLDTRVLRQIITKAREEDIATIITADHGNIEDLTHGGHTNNPVPFISVLPGMESAIADGSLFLDNAADAAINRVAPSFLDALKGAKTPSVMYDSLFKMKEV
jgi:2,3-bisphosphoglycerate-independent phosphoglycerate mutase